MIEEAEYGKNVDVTEVVERIEKWALERGIYADSSAYMQWLKLMEEIGELIAAEMRADTEAIQDAIGDIFVCLVNELALVRKAGDTLGVELPNEGILKSLWIPFPGKVNSVNHFRNLIAQASATNPEKWVNDGYSNIPPQQLCQNIFSLAQGLILYAKQRFPQLNPIWIIEKTISEIESRSGKMQGGIFVKDEKEGRGNPPPPSRENSHAED